MKQAHSVTRWICDQCPLDDKFSSPLFETIHDWRAHYSSTHEMDTQLPSTDLAAKMSERKVLEAIQCPLCPRSAMMSLEEDDHVANHLHSFALRALPWEGNVGSSESWTVVFYGLQQKPYSGAMQNPGKNSDHASSAVDVVQAGEPQSNPQQSLTLAAINREVQLQEANTVTTLFEWLEGVSRQGSSPRDADRRGEPEWEHIEQLLTKASSRAGEPPSTGPNEPDVTSQPKPRGRSRERKTRLWHNILRRHRQEAESPLVYVILSAYRLREATLLKHLKRLFPTYDILIKTHEERSMYKVSIPRALTHVSMNLLQYINALIICILIIMAFREKKKILIDYADHKTLNKLRVYYHSVTKPLHLCGSQVRYINCSTGHWVAPVYRTLSY